MNIERVRLLQDLYDYFQRKHVETVGEMKKHMVEGVGMGAVAYHDKMAQLNGRSQAMLESAQFIDSLIITPLAPEDWKGTDTKQ